MLFIALLLLLAANAWGEDTTRLFGPEEVLEVQLSGPVEALLSGESNQDHIFQITAQGVEQSVLVSVGGRSRRNVCEFLPLTLDFRSAPKTGSENPDNVFSGQESVYITTQCRSTRRSRTDLIEEYLAYRILNLLTDTSYRVRLLQVRLVDGGQGEKGTTLYAFAIESEYRLARRMGGQVLQISQVPKKRLNEEHAALVYVFQYMIGNTDWSLVASTGGDSCCHNGQLVSVGPEIFYVPFDFDLAGLVNAPYAKPDPSLPIKQVTIRLYRGYCGPSDALEKSVRHIVARREAILGLYGEAPSLTRKERNRGIKFLDRFFTAAEDREELLDMFTQRCLE